MSDEHKINQLIQERDDAEQALSQAFYLIIGRPAEWSNEFGYEMALQEIHDAQSALRATIKSLSKQVDELNEAAIESSDF